MSRWLPGIVRPFSATAWPGLITPGELHVNPPLVVDRHPVPEFLSVLALFAHDPVQENAASDAPADSLIGHIATDRARLTQ